ncbi:MAG: tetratricopeptide repeat protein [Myxococcota bacterium]|nr:tetratricopeptide repeat protein [Myxococcota bacterium]
MLPPRAQAIALGLALSAAIAFPIKAPAIDIGDIETEVEELRQQATALAPRYLKTASYKSTQYISERLIDGENFYRTKDYQRAAVIFMDIIENYPASPAYADALFLYADALFLTRDYLGAQVWFKRVLDEVNRPGMARFRHRSIERLIEIAIHLGKFQGIEQYFSQLDQSPTPQARYVQAKYLYFKGDLARARQAFAAVQGDPLLVLKAMYMTGVTLTREGKFDEAIQVFNRAQLHQPNSKEEQEVIDLMNLGAGRLHYEQGFVSNASQAYQRIAENSPYFDAALYEAASVLIRAGDTIRAEQALEFLTVALPDSKYIPRAKMLRGNLLLRTGRYDEAEKVFDEVVVQFTPIIEQLEDIIENQPDTRRFFYELVEKNLVSLDVASMLPQETVKWVNEEKEVQRALVLAGDLGTAKEYVRETARLVHLLDAVINGPSGINAIPVLREAMRRGQQISNRLAQLRGYLMALAEGASAGGMPELARIRSERVALQKQVAALPTSNALYEKREEDAKRIYTEMRSELVRSELRLDQLLAMVVAIERFVSDPRYTEGVSKESIATMKEELGRQRQAVTGMRETLLVLKTDVESGQYQVGVGDAGDKKDEETKKRLLALADQERSVLRARGGDVSQRIERVHRAIDDTEALVSRFVRDVEDEGMRQAREMKEKVRTERQRVATYQTELQLLNDEAQVVVGGVALENISNVRKRFSDLVLKADVGLIDVAWLKKEEHTGRISELTKGRLNDIKVLDDEFHEVKSRQGE